MFGKLTGTGATPRVVMILTRLTVLVVNKDANFTDEVVVDFGERPRLLASSTTYHQRALLPKNRLSFWVSVEKAFPIPDL